MKTKTIHPSRSVLVAAVIAGLVSSVAFAGTFGPGSEAELRFDEIKFVYDVEITDAPDGMKPGIGGTLEFTVERDRSTDTLDRLCKSGFEFEKVRLDATTDKINGEFGTAVLRSAVITRCPQDSRQEQLNNKYPKVTDLTETYELTYQFVELH